MLSLYLVSKAFRRWSERSCRAGLLALAAILGESLLEPPHETHFPRPPEAAAQTQNGDRGPGASLAWAWVAPLCPLPTGRDQSRLLREQGNTSPNSPTSE